MATVQLERKVLFDNSSIDEAAWAFSIIQNQKGYEGTSLLLSTPKQQSPSGSTHPFLSKPKPKIHIPTKH